MPTFTAYYGDDDMEIDDYVSPESGDSTHRSTGPTSTSIIDQAALPNPSLEERTAPGPSGFHFLRLPTEIKRIILEEVFTGSQQTYSIIKGYGHRLETFEYKLTYITDHRNILMASKQCWFEAIELYHESTDLILDGDKDWSMDKMMQYIPSHCFNNVNVLFFSGPCRSLFSPSSVWLRSLSGDREPFPKLREVTLALRDWMIVLESTDNVREKISNEFFNRKSLFDTEPLSGMSGPGLFGNGNTSTSGSGLFSNGNTGRSGTGLSGNSTSSTSSASLFSFPPPSLPRSSLFDNTFSSKRNVKVYKRFEVALRCRQGMYIIEKTLIICIDEKEKKIISSTPELTDYMTFHDL